MKLYLPNGTEIDWYDWDGNGSVSTRRNQPIWYRFTNFVSKEGLSIAQVYCICNLGEELADKIEDGIAYWKPIRDEKPYLGELVKVPVYYL